MSFFKKLGHKFNNAPKGAIFLIMAIVSAFAVRPTLEIATRSGQTIDWIVGGLTVVVAVVSALLYGIYHKLEK